MQAHELKGKEFIIPKYSDVTPIASNPGYYEITVPGAQLSTGDQFTQALVNSWQEQGLIAETQECAPTWVAASRLQLGAIQNHMKSNQAARDVFYNAQEHFIQMAKLADSYNELVTEFNKLKADAEQKKTKRSKG